MAGYIEYSKSVNAAYAENNGCYPLTKAASVVAKKYSVSKKKAATWLKEQGTREWHHSSKFYNEVAYYDTDLEKEDVEELLCYTSADKEQLNESGVYEINWVEFTGSRNYPKKQNRQYKGGAVIKGDWITFCIGEAKYRKKITGNHISINKLGEQHGS